jgi:tetrahydrodipicolinate N-succinyltransferase
MNNEWAKPIPPTDEPISIGSDVWIGAGAMILDGVNIGHGAVVGARSVVTKNVPPYAIVAGVPARIIRYRFTDEIIARLLEIAWWNLDDSVISEKIEFFRNPNVSCELVEEYFGSKS